ncbi:MAG: hypothetical protein AAGD14_02810 [Planctomycetota bacterium]
MRALCLVLCLFLALTPGCATWNVNAFGIPLQASDKYQTSSTSSSGSGGTLSKEEKVGVIVILGLAAAGIAVGAAAAN